MKSSELLLKARGLIDSGRRSYICHALEEVGLKHGAVAVADKIQAGIIADLGGRQSYQGWITAKYCATVYGIGCNEKLRRSRKVWIDALIVYYKSRGD